MHKCTHCQADIADNAQFCSHCGTPAEKSQARSANPDEVDAHEEDLDTTSKQPVVTVPATPTLPTLRTRRMHPKSSIPEFPQDPWLPAKSIDEDEGTMSVGTLQDKQSASSPILQLPLTPPVEIRDDFPQIQVTSDETEDAASTLIAQTKKPFQANIGTSPLPTFPTATPDEISSSPTGELTQLSANSRAIPDEISSSPTGELAQLSANSHAIPDEISSSPTSELAQLPASSASGADEISAAPTGELKYASPFPPPTPERRSTPRPTNTMILSQKKAASKTRVLIAAMLIILVVLIGGAGVGAFALIHQNASTGATTQCNTQQTNCAGGSSTQVNGKPTHLTFSGTVVGPMSIVAKPRCQISSAGTLRVLTVNLSGTINSQLYNFSFVIEHYKGPATYSNNAATTTILFDVPGQSTTNGWNNSTPTDNGSITVARGEQTGSISYTLSGVGTQANTQIQTAGNWTCGN